MNSHDEERLHRMEVALFGTKSDQSDGLVSIVTTQNRTLFGTKLDPGGLEKAVRANTRVVWMVTGIVGAIEFYAKFLHPMIHSSSQ